MRSKNIPMSLDRGEEVKKSEPDAGHGDTVMWFEVMSWQSLCMDEPQLGPQDQQSQGDAESHGEQPAFTVPLLHQL